MSETEAQIYNARQLFAGAFHGILSTHSLNQTGYPFGSLVPYCIDYDGWPVMLLSHLSQHTQNLDADPKVAITTSEQGDGGDVQTLARLTCLADAEFLPINATATVERYFRYFPGQRQYFEQLNFRFYRLKPNRFYYVGGFGAARWFGIDRVLLPNPFSPTEEQALIRNLLHDTLKSRRAFLAGAPSITSADSDWEVVGFDSLGLDIRAGERLNRIPFPDPASNADQVEAALIEILGG